MTKSLPSLASLLAAALAVNTALGQNSQREAGDAEFRKDLDAPSTERRVPSSELPSAARLMADIIATTRARDSISARLRHKINILGQPLVGTGLYQQQGRGEEQKIRLELKVQVADQTTSMQQICDGTFLWQHQDLLDKSTLSRIDVRRVREAVFDRRGRRSRFEQIQLALCGLPKLLESLDAAFAFRIVQQDRLDGVPVYVLRGDWRPEQLAAVYPDHKAGKANQADGQGVGPAPGRLPPHAPEVIVLLVGRDDLFPYRIEYRRRVVADENTPQRTQAATPLVIMEWFEVALDTPIDQRQFTYRPGDLDFTDGTDKLLVHMGLAEE